MDINSKVFKDKLKKLCQENWKAEGILKSKNYRFENLQPIQQKMFLKAMDLSEIDIVKTIETN